MNSARECIENGQAVLGIEFGSTRIKAVLIDGEHTPIASGSHEWENRLENGFWTYSLEDIWTGLRSCYRSLLKEVRERYGVPVKRLRAIGLSAMMHGYMAFDEEGELLTPFRTWRNGTTGPASEALTELFQYQIPQRWSTAHLYQAVLNKEEHVPAIRFMTTLAGYVHWKLTGEKVLGIGDASGMFPIDTKTKQYDPAMLDRFDALVKDEGYPWRLRELLPVIRLAGEPAGALTGKGARLLDESGELEAGIPLCPPEGDAGTGMTATNSVTVGAGNVSAGTSAFVMVVLDKPLQRIHPEIDLVTTPDGSLVGMVHANNCTSEINAWAGLFKEVLESFGASADPDRLYSTLYQKALEGAGDCGGLLAYGFLSGENIVNVAEGRPMLVRTPKSRFTLANLMRAQFSASLGALKIGMDILTKEEHAKVLKLYGHGGFFKTPIVGQRLMAAAMETPISVMETAGEGGAWGIALLAAYMAGKKDNEALGDYLSERVFAGNGGSSLEPVKEDVEGFSHFMEAFKAGLFLEREAAAHVGM
ncbi:MAG: FGGY-family carbohydrate kinase [Lachnospiraceae bacterium]|nr:FGGY-family carbohydrate kinase [Lachnospiraceae bacterium]